MARRSSVGRLYIARLRPSEDPVNAAYLLTFGSPATTDIALNLGSVRGLDGLTDVLRAGRVPLYEIEKAWRILAMEVTHQIPNVTLTRAMFQRLNL
jgi:hypothetical protein